MTYRKFKADYLFTGEVFAPQDSVLITTDDGIVQDIVPAAAAGEDVEYFPGILTPGFVNCHCHLELSHMKGVQAERTGLVDFLITVIRRRGQVASPEVIARAIADAEQEMFDGGIVAVGDICNTADTLAVKTAGRLFYHNFVEALGFMDESAPQRFAEYLKVFQAFAEAYPIPIESNSIVPHAPYTVSPALYRLIADFPGNHVLTIHNQETEAENTFSLTGKGDFLKLYESIGLDASFYKGTGKRSLASFLPYFYRNQTLILVHNVETREEDLVGLGPAGSGPAIFFCLCPNANLYISGVLPDVGVLRRSGRPIVLGTDSLTSNHQLSILEEMKTLQRAFPDLELQELLGWATRNGAEALQLSSLLGRFGEGMQPGMVLIEGSAGLKLGDGARSRRLM